MLLIILILTQIKANSSSVDFKESSSVPEPSVIVQPIQPVLEKQPLQYILKKQSAEIKVKDDKSIKNGYIENHWRKSFRLPLSIENKAYGLAMARRGFCNSSSEARSNIDRDIGFNSVKDILSYLPRAVQIVFLAPFPNQWLLEGSCRANSLMRRISGFEMTVTYFALIFLPYAIWRWRRRIETWTIFAFCVYMMLIYGLVVSNVGSLYRMRYPYLTILVALGIAGFIAFIEDLKVKRNIK
ncbi:MAG: hypothetical protein PHV48_05185 [Candidatus Omnitrophica bacterium]|nr:hypothetical protein [Candidatus Omnitrophota bacterium]